MAHGYEVPKDKLYRFQPSWEFADYMKLNNDIDPTPFLEPLLQLRGGSRLTGGMRPPQT
ncbi:hypothetical protein NIB75_05370 [Bacteroides uniformis]|nr:hypothetical protein [Bacteroides uniformis]